MGVSRAPGLSGEVFQATVPRTHRGNFKTEGKKVRVGQTAAPALPVASQCYDPMPWTRTCSRPDDTGCLQLFYHAALRFCLAPLTLPFSVFSLASLSLSSAREAGCAGEVLDRRISADLCQRHVPVGPMHACCECPLLSQTHPHKMSPLKFFNGIKLWLSLQLPQ